MRGEIIAVGSELLLGEIANTNAQYLSEWLATCGIGVYYHSVVGDNAERMKESFELARSRADLIVITGGLGPTEDDLTKEVLAEMLGRKLVLDAPAYEKIETFFKGRSLQVTEGNRKQALVIEGGEVLSNEAGLAPGIVIKDQDKQFILLPGVPREMKRILSDHFSHLLGKETIQSRTLRFFGIGESALNDLLKEQIRTAANPSIAPYADLAEVRLRLTAKANSEEEARLMLDQVETEIHAVAGEYFYGHDEASLPGVVHSSLRAENATLAAAESLTGGMFAKGLTDLAGVSSVFRGSVVAYDRQAKEKLLAVESSLIDTEGVVSEAVAIQMAAGAKEAFQSDYAIAFTGEAGPDSGSGVKVGTVCCAIATPDDVVVRTFHYASSDRSMIRLRAVKDGYFWLYKLLNRKNA